MVHTYFQMPLISFWGPVLSVLTLIYSIVTRYLKTQSFKQIDTSTIIELCVTNWPLHKLCVGDMLPFIPPHTRAQKQYSFQSFLFDRTTNFVIASSICSEDPHPLIRISCTQIATPDIAHLFIMRILTIEIAAMCLCDKQLPNSILSRYLKYTLFTSEVGRSTYFTGENFLNDFNFRLTVQMVLISVLIFNLEIDPLNVFNPYIRGIKIKPALVHGTKLDQVITWALSQYPKRRLSVRSRKVSKPRDWYFKLSYRFEIWQAHRQHCCRSACQISERSDNI